jgi:uncharacterized membrane protein
MTDAADASGNAGSAKGGRARGGRARGVLAAAQAIARALAFMGRHSLIIYLAHLPLLFGLALVLKLVL